MSTTVSASDGKANVWPGLARPSRVLAEHPPFDSCDAKFDRSEADNQTDHDQQHDGGAVADSPAVRAHDLAEIAKAPAEGLGDGRSLCYPDGGLPWRPTGAVDPVGRRRSRGPGRRRWRSGTRGWTARWTWEPICDE